MIQLKYKTRDNTRTKDKSKVYFTAHPKDYKYFDEIVEEILDKQNCTIFYFDDFSDDIDYEDFALQLNQMQLFVIPITNNFLNTKNRALDFELRYAIEHHIPVLPLMYGEHLEQDFNNKCGNLQFLDKFKKDETAISYEKKLNDFLSAILINDKLASEIRDAFDAYVFLSYRKKDRKYAQELMKLIHRNDTFRDIAIWYDEFLTPGENFDKEIDDALNKSKLFALVVTPNLVNEENYVMKIEYPRAKEINKPILAAESVKTNHQDLKTKYIDIPDCIDAYDEVKLSEAMLEFLKGLATTENDTPEHNYLIGLAYLKGIDVEVDKEKALGLITDSADKGNINAIKKLIEMYDIGDSVRRDEKERLKWEERLVEEYKNREKDINQKYKKEDQEYLEFYSEYIEATTSCGFQNILYFDAQKGEKIIFEAFDIIEKIKANEEKYYTCLADAYFVLGSSYEIRQRFIKAEEYQSKKLECNKRLMEIDEQKYLYDLCEAYYTLAKVHRLSNHLKQAEESLDIAIKLYEKALLNEYEDEKKIETSLASCYYEAGVVQLLFDKVEVVQDKAGYFFAKALEYCRKQVVGKPTRYNLAIFEKTISDIANFAISLDKYDIAQKLYDEIIEVLSKQKDENLKEDCNDEIGNIYFELANAYLKKKDDDLTEYYYNKAIDQYQTLCLDDAMYFNRLAAIYASFSFYYENKNDYEKAEELIFKALALVKDNKECYTVPHVHIKLSDYYERRGQFDKAEQMLVEAIEYAKKLEKDSPNVYFEFMYNCYMDKYAQLCMKINKDAYELCYKPLVDLYLKLPSDSPHTYSLNVAFALYFYGGSRKWTTKDLDKMEELYDAALKCFVKLDEETPRDLKEYIGLIYNDLAKLYYDKNDLEKAKEYINKALDITNNLEKVYPYKVNTLKLMTRIYPENKHKYYKEAIELSYECIEKSEDEGKESMLNDCIQVLNEYGYVEYELGNKEHAMELFKKALEKVKEIYREDQAEVYNKLLGECYFNIGYNGEDYTESIEYLYKALDIYKTIAKKDHNDTDLQYKMGRTLNALGYMFAQLNEYDKSTKLTKEAINISKSLASNVHISHLWDVAKYTANIGHNYKSIGNYRIARKYFKDALSAIESLKEDKVNYLWGLVNYNQNIVRCALEENRFIVARRAMQEILNSLIKLYKFKEDIPTYRVTDINDISADNYSMVNKNILECFEKLISIYKKKIKENDTFYLNEIMKLCFIFIANSKNKGKQIKYIKEAINCLNKLLDIPSNISYSVLYTFELVYEDILNIVKRLNDKDMLEKVYKLAIKLYRCICGSQGEEDEHISSLIDSYINLADIYYNNKKYKQSLNNYHMALQGYELLIDIDKNDEEELQKHKKSVANIYRKLLIVYNELNRKNNLSKEFIKIKDYFE